MSLAIGTALLSRGNNISKLSDDAHQNTLCVINDRIDDIDPAAQYPTNEPHADVYQMHVASVPNPDNIIVYGIFATNIHYQGIFARPAGPGSKGATNVAFVNNFVEARSPLRGPGGGTSSLQGVWDHLILWNNTFTGREMVIYKDSETKVFGFTNVSIVGNYFHAFRDAQSNGKAFDIGNTNNNEAISNHYYRSYDDGYGSDNRTHSPDTVSPASASAGTFELNLTDKTNYTNFGRPANSSSVLLNRISKVRVQSDCANTRRGSAADIGAFERDVESGSTMKSPPSPPKLFVR